MTLFEGLLPGGIATSCTRLGPVETAPALWPGEAAAMQSAAPGRRAEFAFGQSCARNAMRQLGYVPQPVPVNDDRSPRWPADLVGSISHNGQYCIAAVGLAAAFTSVGIDIESDEALPEDLWPIICTDRERAFLDALPTSMRGATAKVVFSAKETVYKVQAPVTGRFLEFTDVELRIDLDDGTFVATALTFDDLVPGRTSIEGRFAFRDGLILTAAALVRNG